LFSCSRCGIGVKKIKTAAHKKGKCRSKCDGVQRDRGGYPLDSHLRAIYISKLRGKTETQRKTDPKFYETGAWRKLRYLTLKKYGRKCMVCFRTNLELHVDHIKPISLVPDLALDETNLQVLCRDCNLGKGNSDSIDWRPKET
jgi:5-methylcytosine-specific restriction endonuclease McrA